MYEYTRALIFQNFYPTGKSLDERRRLFQEARGRRGGAGGGGRAEEEETFHCSSDFEPHVTTPNLEQGHGNMQLFKRVLIGLLVRGTTTDHIEENSSTYYPKWDKASGQKTRTNTISLLNFALETKQQRHLRKSKLASTQTKRGPSP